MSKPTLSEIRARRKQLDTIYASRAKFPHLLPGPSQIDRDNEYLLDLVKRLGKVLGEMEKDYPADPECWPIAKKARALLLEVKE